MNEELYNQIDAYLLGRMTTADRKDFERAMHQDATLQTQVAEQRDLMAGAQIVGREQLQRTVRSVADELDLDAIDVPIYGDFSDAAMQKGIKVVGKERLQNDLADLQQELENEDFFTDVFAKIEQDNTAVKTPPPPQQEAKVRRLVPRSRWWAVAASVALVVAITGIIIFNLNPASPTGLAAAFEPQTEMLSQRIDAQLTGAGMGTGAVQTQLQQIKTGLNDLQQQKYTAAIANLSIENSAFLSSTDRQLLQLALGQAQLGAEQFTNAIQTLTPLAENPNFTAREDAQWYLLLAYANTDNAGKVIDLKQQLQSSEKYAEKIKSI